MRLKNNILSTQLRNSACGGVHHTELNQIELSIGGGHVYELNDNPDATHHHPNGQLYLSNKAFLDENDALTTQNSGVPGRDSTISEEVSNNISEDVEEGGVIIPSLVPSDKDIGLDRNGSKRRHDPRGLVLIVSPLARLELYHKHKHNPIYIITLNM